MPRRHRLRDHRGCCDHAGVGAVRIAPASDRCACCDTPPPASVRPPRAARRPARAGRPRSPSRVAAHVGSEVDAASACLRHARCAPRSAPSRPGSAAVRPAGAPSRASTLTCAASAARTRGCPTGAAMVDGSRRRRGGRVRGVSRRPVQRIAVAKEGRARRSVSRRRAQPCSGAALNEGSEPTATRHRAARASVGSMDGAERGVVRGGGSRCASATRPVSWPAPATTQQKRVRRSVARFGLDCSVDRRRPRCGTRAACASSVAGSATAGSCSVAAGHGAD